MNAIALGTPSIQQFTVNAAGQVKTIVSPRTDVVSRTAFDYDAAGNLSILTDAADHRTTFSRYDIHGRPGLITDPNSLATELEYNERGWLTSSNSGGESTTYTYDGVGQLKTAATSGGPIITYSYDAAHRLIGVTDNLSNSVTYTLDLTGNRLSEQTRDPQGVLSRQVSRVYNLMNRLEKVTGAQQ
jgi:YD repeat-containing protein